MKNLIKILYIEDNEPDRRAFFQAVSEKGLSYEVTPAETLEEARARLKQFPADLIIANYNLPDGHSTELLDEVSEVPLILMADTPEEEVALRILESGADDYLPKDKERRYLDALPLAVQKTLRRKRIDDMERRLTQELRQSEERLASFMCHLPGAAWIKDLDGRYVFVNSEAERIFGVPSEMVQGKRDDEIFPPETAREFQENDRRALEEEDGLQAIEVLRQIDGVDHHSVVRKFALRGPGARPAYIAGVAFDLTERMQAEEALREREQRLLATFENAASGIIQTDSQDRFIAVNERLCQMLGYSREELLGKSVHELTYAEDKERCDDLNAQLHEGRLPWFQCERRYLKRDGSPLWVHLAVSAVRDGAGRYLYSVGTVVDISARKAAEAQVRLQAAALEAAPNAISVSTTDREGTIVWVNSAFTQLTGFSAEESIGRNHRILSSGLQDKEFYRNLWETIERGEVWRGELVNRRKDGSLYHEEMGITPLRDERGNVTHYVAIKQDITAWKEAEEKLRKSERRFRMLADAIPQLAWIARPDGWIYWYNRRWYEYTGATPEQMEGWGWQSVHDPETLPAVLERWKSSIETGAPFDMVFPLRRADGVFRPFLTRVMPLKDEQGRVTQWFGTNTDISEQRRAEEELAAAKTSAERAKAAAEHANRAKDHFLAVLSHELRTPLTPVVMGVSLLQDRLDLDPDVRETLEMIRSNVEMESRLIDDLLDVTRIARGKIELNQAPVDVCRVIQRAVDVCKPDIEARRLHFGMDLGPSAPYWVKADVSRLQQVFWNLLKNALKFTPNGGCVGIRCRPSNEHVIIEVNDSGIGIEPEALSRVFDAFEQAERSITRQFGGLGLGLAISKALVEMHGGTIEAHSNGRNQGATFRVHLPLNAPVRQAEEARPFPSPDKVVMPLRILLVEDHGVTAHMIKMVLSEKGHEVEIAGDMATALELADRRSFDLLVSDLGLPDGSGHDLIRELRMRGKKFPGIALSGYGQERDINLSYEAGFAAHLIKPASREAIFAAVAAAAKGNEHPSPDFSVAHSAPSDLPIFDADAALKRCFGKREMLEEMVEFFPKESGELLGQMYSALGKADVADVRRVTHRLKGSLFYLGAQPAVEAAARVEEAAKSGYMEAVEKAVFELGQQVDALKNTLAGHTTNPGSGNREG